MFTHEDIQNENKIIVNPVQEYPQRVSVYSLYKCEDQVIGFEFLKREESGTKCFNNILVNLCVPIEMIYPLENIESVEFIATDDPCYTDCLVIKTTTPDIEIERDIDNNILGILVKFFREETCCFPTQLSFKLLAVHENGSKFSIARGLLVFK